MNKLGKSMMHLRTLVLCVLGALLCAAAHVQANPSATIQATSRPTLTGTNLSGAEFGPADGPFGQAYIYPTTTDLTFVSKAGMNVVRLPVLWERLQPSLTGPLDGQELRRLMLFIDQASMLKIKVIIDIHNYARYRGQLLATEKVPSTAFADLWLKLAPHVRDKPFVILGLMNEPHGLGSLAWVSAANDAIVAIRAGGARNLILAPGVAWTGAHSWQSNYYGTPNSEAMLKIFDPAGNTAIEVHQYLDVDSSGTSNECVHDNIGVERLTGFTAWAKKHKLKAFLGEFAAGKGKICEAAVSKMLGYIASNADVWLGWSWWSAGPWWGDYPFSIQPDANGSPKPQAAWLAPFLYNDRRN